MPGSGNGLRHNSERLTRAVREAWRMPASGPRPHPHSAIQFEATRDPGKRVDGEEEKVEANRDEAPNRLEAARSAHTCRARICTSAIKLNLN